MIDRRSLLAAGLGGLGGGFAGTSRSATRPFGGPGSLEGLWTMSSWTDFERPPEIDHLVLTPAEAEAYEAPRRKLGGMLGSQPGAVGQAENEYIDRGKGLARVRGEIRSSWIVDPPDGRIPYRPEVLAGLDKHKDPSQRHFDGPEQLSGPERCTASIAAGAPLVGAPDANLFQIVEAGDCIAIEVEKYHDVRIVRCGPAPAAAPPPSWLGESAGRWEGPTLVVETVGFRPGITNRGLRHYQSGATRVAERFTRSGPTELLYAFEVTDPTLYTRPWRGEMSFQAESGRIFEYACHEGNYGLMGILAGARREERDAAAR